MAKMLIEQLSTPFEPEKYSDDYRGALLDAIQHKVAGEEVQAAPEQKKTNVIDLMAALQASLEATKPIAAPDASKPAGRKKAGDTATTAGANARNAAEERPAATPAPAPAPTKAAASTAAKPKGGSKKAKETVS
jgi:DNA end-binding protein Ku